MAEAKYSDTKARPLQDGEVKLDFTYETDTRNARMQATIHVTGEERSPGLRDMPAVRQFLEDTFDIVVDSPDPNTLVLESNSVTRPGSPAYHLFPLKHTEYALFEEARSLTDTIQKELSGEHFKIPVDGFDEALSVRTNFVSAENRHRLTISIKGDQEEGMLAAKRLLPSLQERLLSEDNDDRINSVRMGASGSNLILLEVETASAEPIKI